MAGHSKFKNIMHRKGAQDKKRAKLFSRLIREITVAARIGGPESSSNPRLRSAINNALSANMSKENIDRAIQRNNNSETSSIQEIIYEGFGPSGVAILVESLTDNRNRSASEIRSAFSKYNGNLGINGCAKPYFQRKGIILYPVEKIDFNEFFEFCISINAEDLTELDSKYEILTSVELFNEILVKLEKKYSVPDFSNLEWRPLNVIEVNDENHAKNLLHLLQKLEDIDDVQNVSSNFDINEKLMEKIV